MVKPLIDSAVSVVDHATNGPEDSCPWYVVVSNLTSDPVRDASADDVLDALEQAVRDGRLRTNDAGDEFWLPE